MIHTAKDAYKWQWRMEATEGACNDYGWESKECQQFIDIYDKQYAANKIGQTGSEISAFVFKIVIAVVILWWIIPKVITLYAKNNEKQ